MAGQEAHVYKYADRSQLFYQCQISITIKEPNSECARPQCAEPTGFGAQKVGGGAAGGAAAGGAAATGRPAPAQLRLLKREAGFDQFDTLDVRAELNALDISNEDANLPSSLRYRAEPVSMKPVSEGICMSSFGFLSFIAIGMAMVAVVVVVASCALRPVSVKA